MKTKRKKHCPHCGSPTESHHVNCPVCGREQHTVRRHLVFSARLSRKGAGK